MDIDKITACCKALGDSTRIEIVEMLKNGTMCACKILEKFNMTQSTLSYHMKQLSDCGLVLVDKDWKWSYYSLNCDVWNNLGKYFVVKENHDKSCNCDKC